MFTLSEGTSAPQKTSKGTWRAVLITPGKGSSGIYTEEMLREYGPVAFPKGTHSYIDHPTQEGEVRSPKNLMGVLAEDAVYQEGVGLVGEIKVMEHWRPFVEEVAPHTGLSIYAMGEGVRNEEGDIVVESLVPHTQNSVDLVSYAGRPGSKLAEKLYEAAVSVFHEAAPGELAEKDLVKWAQGDDIMYGQVAYVMTSGVFPFEGDPLEIAATEEAPVALVRVWENNDGEWTATQVLMGAPISALTKVSALGETARRRNKGTAAESAAATAPNMEEGNSNMDEIKAMLEELRTSIEERFAQLAETLTPAVETEENEELDVAAVAEAMVAAGLPEVSRKAVYEALRNGGDLTDAIDGQKAFVESVKAHITETQAVVAERATDVVIEETAAKAERLGAVLNVKVGH